MDELYSLSRSIDRVTTEQIDQKRSGKKIQIKMKLQKLCSKIWTQSNSLYKLPDKNIDKSYECGHSRGDKFKIPKNTVTTDSYYRNKFVEKEIPTSYIKFDCLNIDQDVVITNEVKDNGLSYNKKSDQVLWPKATILSSKATIQKTSSSCK